jgi:hypothetical protein
MKKEGNEIMMVQTTQPTFQYKRAIVTFLLAYLAITVVATGFSLQASAVPQMLG